MIFRQLNICMKKFKQADRRRLKYGVDAFRMNIMLEAQDHKCAICHKEINNNTLCVDHDHHTLDPHDDPVRGLLCHKCNSGIGFFNDNIIILQSAIDYLKRTKLTDF